MNTNIIEKGSLLIPAFKKNALVKVGEILYVEAMQNYSMIYIEDGSRILVSLSFGKLLNILTDHGVYQTHKSYAVNLKHVQGYHLSKGIVMPDGVRVPLARRRKRAFLYQLST